MPGFSFQNQTVQVVEANVETLLGDFRRQLDDFAKNEGLAKHLADIYKRNDNEAIRAIDRKVVSDWSSKFWQTRDWHFGFMKVVPLLGMELIKLAPKNRVELEKIVKFWDKPFKWNPPAANLHEGVAKKYLSFLKALRDQLADCQEAATEGATKDVVPVKVGKFSLYDSLGVDESTRKNVEDTIEKAAGAMRGLGLGEYCYGKVTIVDASKFRSHAAAFYVKNTDEIYISPDLKGEDVRALCHEIAHRVHTKLNLDPRSKELYQTVKERGTWVTGYAKTDNEENFCEMVSFAAMKRLPDDSRALLEAALPKIKLASRVAARYLDSLAQRVAARYRLAFTTELPAAFPKNEIGLMTKEEFLDFKNPEGKHHETGSYDFDMMKLNQDYPSNVGAAGNGDDRYLVVKYSRGYQVLHEDEPVAIIHNEVAYYDQPSMKRRIPTRVFDGPRSTDLEIKSYKQVKYLSEVMPLISPIAKLNEDHFPVVLQHLKVQGEAMALRAEKQPVKNKGTSLAIFNSEGYIVARGSDEWGATLLTVASEYRGKGLGKLIGHYWYEYNPEYTSGGFTEAGERNAIELWKDQVREFNSRGWYSALIRRGDISVAKVKQILQEVGQHAPSKSTPSSEPKTKSEVLVFADDITFVVYDSAFLDEPEPDEKHIHGFGFFRDATVGTFLYCIEYDRPFADLTTRVALQMARDNGDKLYNGEGYHDMIEGVDKIPGVVLEGDYITVTRDLLPLKSLAAKERKLRKSADPYDEKYSQLVEMAESKW